MAAVTVNSQSQPNVNGSTRELFYNVSIATTGDTLATPLRRINSVTSSTVSITSVATSGGTITFTTTGGAVNNANVKVQGN